MSIKLNIISRPLINEVEQFIIKKINKNPPIIYAPITNKEIDKIKKNTIDKFPDNSDQISKNLINSIRSSYTKNHMINNHQKLIKNSHKIINDYSNGKSVLEISGQFDVSPLNILREVFLSKYKTKLTKLIIHPDILSSHDKDQLSIAIENDDYALIDGTEVMKESVGFEKQIEHFLNKNSIKYITQEELVKEQIKKYGQPINTPDFLIKSDLYIGNYKINWIDAKNFYGSTVPFVKNKIKKQTLKYLNEWGSGSIIFSLGFNQNLKFTNILFLGFQDLLNNK
jgi:hypothetical protein